MRGRRRACSRRWVIGLAAALGVLAGASPVGGDEKIIELAGRIDATELGIPPGRFTVRALRPQKRSGELARATGDADGRFRVRVAEEAVGVYGVLLEATSATAPGILPASISLRRARLTRSSRSDERPTSSGFAVGSPWARAIAG